MRATLIGGTGHIGRFLAGQLVEDGWQVTVVTSGRSPLPREPGWDKVRHVTAKYDGGPEWRRLIAELKGDLVVDIIQSDLAGTYDAARGTAKHYIVCGSVWMLGAPTVVPAPETFFGEALGPSYQRRRAIMQETFQRAPGAGLPLTAVFPPNICGPGKVPLDTVGGRSVEVHRALAAGKPVQLPKGLNTLISPCDAADVAQVFRLAARRPEAAAGQIFNAGPAYAVTVPRLVEVFGEIHGVRIPIEWITTERFYREVASTAGQAFHFRHHMCPDIRKAAERLGYRPQFTCEQTLARAIAWMKEQRLL
jgi:nucleoside-diphosphate-sugar epimerase